MHPPPPSRSAGISFVELLVVVAVLALLAGLIAPVLSGGTEQARVKRASAEVLTIAEALRRFHVSTGGWPTLDAQGERDTLHLLVSGPALPTSDPWGDGSTWWSWIQQGQADLLDNHLFRNRPKGQSTHTYPTGGSSGWRGPYLEPAPLDPWGRPYVVNVVCTWSDSTSQYRRMWVLSAGPDGRFQTEASAGPTAAIAGDDIGLLVWRR